MIFVLFGLIILCGVVNKNVMVVFMKFIVMKMMYMLGGILVVML